jgi:transcriptional regulator with XRE-family HTH domain
METTLNTELLANMLKNKRGNAGLRATAEAIGSVSAATLSRIEQGRIPDVDTLIRLCNWLEVPTDTFVVREEGADVVEIDHQQTIVAHLRADRELDAETMDMLVKLVNLAYSTKTPKPVREKQD